MSKKCSDQLASKVVQSYFLLRQVCFLVLKVHDNGSWKPSFGSYIVCLENAEVRNCEHPLLSVGYLCFIIQNWAFCWSKTFTLQHQLWDEQNEMMVSLLFQYGFLPQLFDSVTPGDPPLWIFVTEVTVYLYWRTTRRQQWACWQCHRLKIQVNRTQAHTVFTDTFVDLLLVALA